MLLPDRHPGGVQSAGRVRDPGAPFNGREDARRYWAARQGMERFQGHPSTRPGTRLAAARWFRPTWTTTEGNHGEAGDQQVLGQPGAAVDAAAPESLRAVVYGRQSVKMTRPGVMEPFSIERGERRTTISQDNNTTVSHLQNPSAHAREILSRITT